MKRILLVISFAVLAGSACGGGHTATSTPTSAPVDPTVIASRAALAVKAALIGAPDLPAGWTGEPPDHTVGELNMSPPCPA